MKMTTNTGFDRVEKAIVESSLDETEKSKILKKLMEEKAHKANILITGATGCGKSSTINALFNMEKAKVGTGVDPETMEIERFELGNMILWDSPGLGDGKESDIRHSRGIIDKLHEKDENGELLIDIVLVILDGSSRDLGTSYELINQVIIPNIGDTKRIIIGINQADVAMKGKNWDSENSKPLPPLQSFLDEKADSVKRRIKEGTGVNVEDPVCYSAGYKEEGQPHQEKPYNLSKLLYYIITHIPTEKRIPVLVETNQSQEMWESNDDIVNYNKEISENVGLSFLKDAGVGATSGAALGAAIGSVIPVVGTAIGAAVGAVGGAIIGGVKHVFGCFITTATCMSLGKPDDCYELAAFRDFRDNWLVKQPDGEQLVAGYYDIAPGIVSAIDQIPERETIYRNIWETYLSQCLKSIEAGNYDDCKTRYMDMVNSLQLEYADNKA
jgi:predicted GTPase